MRQTPVVSFDVVQWDDGTFTCPYRDFRSQTAVGTVFTRYQSIQELAKQMQKIVEECRESPKLIFRIERHGATVMGSSRAELQEWTIDPCPYLFFYGGC